MQFWLPIDKITDFKLHILKTLLYKTCELDFSIVLQLLHLLNIFINTTTPCMSSNTRNLDYFFFSVKTHWKMDISLIPNSGSAAGARIDVLFKCQKPEKTLVPKTTLTTQCRQGFLSGGKGKAEQTNQREELRACKQNSIKFLFPVTIPHYQIFLHIYGDINVFWIIWGNEKLEPVLKKKISWVKSRYTS